MSAITLSDFESQFSIQVSQENRLKLQSWHKFPCKHFCYLTVDMTKGCFLVRKSCKSCNNQNGAALSRDEIHTVCCTLMGHVWCCAPQVSQYLKGRGII